MGAPSLTVIALETEFAVGAHLVIDFDGQTGGKGSASLTTAFCVRALLLARRYLTA